MVNDKDLQMEVMRYDKENIVTGVKQISNVNVETLTVGERIFVQDVPLNTWIKNAIFKTGTFNITGHKTFNGFVEFETGLL